MISVTITHTYARRDERNESFNGVADTLARALYNAITKQNTAYYGGNEVQDCPCLNPRISFDDLAAMYAEWNEEGDVCHELLVTLA